jgi:hypothetical protein
MVRGVSYVHINTLVVVAYIRNTLPADMGIPSPADLALSGWGYADFHGVSRYSASAHAPMSTAPASHSTASTTIAGSLRNRL